MELTPYNSNKLDESVLWTESKDLGDGYHTIRMVSNIQLNMDAFNGDKNHGGVHDGTRIVLWEWKKDANQRWKIASHCKNLCLYALEFLFKLLPIAYFSHVSDAYLCSWMCRSGYIICGGLHRSFFRKWM